MRSDLPAPRILAASLVVCAAALASACGTEIADEDSPDASVAGATEAPADAGVELVGGSHGSGEVDGHELAAGEATPKDPLGRLYLHHDDTGADVETLQERLVELGASIGAVDGVFGDATLHAVLQFQRSEGLTADGVVGTATWSALDDPEKAPDFTEPEVPETYDDSVPTTSAAPESSPAPGTADTGDAASVGPQDPPAGDPGAGKWSRAVVTLSSSSAVFYDAEGNVVFQAPVSAGRSGLTPVGTFHVQSKSERAYAGGGSGVYMDHMVRFNGGVGFHSIPKHSDGSPLDTPLGRANVSHGCVRMADDVAATVFANLPIGATVEVHA